MTDSYNASSIHIASDEEVLDRWDWARVAHWAHQYRVPESWLSRSLEACRRAGVDPSYIEARYLRQDGSVGVKMCIRDRCITHGFVLLTHICYINYFFRSL